MESNLSGGSHNLPVVNQEGSAPSEIHDMCVGSTLYWNTPNVPSTTNDYHNASKKLGGGNDHPMMGW